MNYKSVNNLYGKAILLTAESLLDLEEEVRKQHLSTDKKELDGALLVVQFLKDCYKKIE